MGLYWTPLQLITFSSNSAETVALVRNPPSTTRNCGQTIVPLLFDCCLSVRISRNASQFQCSFSAVSEQFHNNFSTVLEQFQISFSAVLEQFRRSFRKISEQFQCTFRAILEQFRSNVRAVSEKFLISFSAVLEQFQSSFIAIF